MRSLVWEGGDSTAYYPIIASAWTMARVSIITKKVHKGTEKYWKVWTSKKYKSRSYHPIIASVDTPLRQGRRGTTQSIIAVPVGEGTPTVDTGTEGRTWEYNSLCAHAAGPIMGSTWELNSL